MLHGHKLWISHTFICVVHLQESSVFRLYKQSTHLFPGSIMHAMFNKALTLNRITTEGLKVQEQQEKVQTEEEG